MRSLLELRRRWLVGCAALLLQGTSVHVLAASPEAPNDAAVARALETLRADPNLKEERQAKRLRWREDSPEPVRETRAPRFEIVTWIARFGRVVMWLMVAAALVVIGITLVRYAGRWRRATPQGSSLPTHVQDLDIRPEGLPADIGSAAFELWQRGERRACLALLYRGLLSRLVHTHAVPITAASTEGDCVLLARTHLPEPSQSYAQQLVRVWQNAVYGAREPDETTVRALCSEFATALQGATAPSIAVRPSR